jgi:hypothetical protein
MLRVPDENIILEEDGDGEPSCLGKRVYQNSEVENRVINS